MPEPRGSPAWPCPLDRHRIQRRDDAKRYTLGVLGLGSLILTEVRYEHDDILKPTPDPEQ